MPMPRIPPKVRDWLLITLYLGFGGPLLVIAAWGTIKGELPITLRLIAGLIFIVLMVAGGFFILGQRLGVISEDDEGNQDRS